MCKIYSDEWFEKQRKKDEEVCPEAWAEGEVDIMQMTVGQFTEYRERMFKIQELSLISSTICRQVKLMREAIEIITAHEKKEPEKT